MTACGPISLNRLSIQAGFRVSAPVIAPSLEDKVMRFTDKERHPVVLEFEGIDTEEIYAKGLGNSLPPHLQEMIVHSVPGLETAEIMRFAYAIEYDFVQPTQLRPTLETKQIHNLYLAGQINGTSGYEEAAAQGLWAGINAALAVQGRPPFHLTRAEAYMGVMVDDLVTKGVDEPYRMFTSRAEYRLILREDNAVLRLAEKGFHLGLIGPSEYSRIRERKERIEEGIARLSTARIYPVGDVNNALEQMGTAPIKNPVSLFQLLKRDGITHDRLDAFPGWAPITDVQVKKQIEIEAKYEGYIKRQREAVAKMEVSEQKKIAGHIDYDDVPGLSNELRMKFKKVEPATIGQAARIPGMTQAAINAVLVAMKKKELEEEQKKKSLGGKE